MTSHTICRPVTDVDDTDSSEEWLVHRRCCRHAQRECQRLHVWTYEAATSTRGLMGEVLRMPLSSLSCLTACGCRQGQTSDAQDV